MAYPAFLPCPVCAALVQYDEDAQRRHSRWHRESGTCPPGATLDDLAHQWRTVRATEQDAGRPLGGDDDTVQFPPITATVRRRPPVPPAARTLAGPELLRALADAMEADPDVDVDDLVELRAVDEDLADDVVDGLTLCAPCGHNRGAHSDDGGRWCGISYCDCLGFRA